MSFIKTLNVSNFILQNERYTVIFYDEKKSLLKLSKFNHPLLAMSWFNNKRKQKWTHCIIIDEIKKIKFYYQNPLNKN